MHIAFDAKRAYRNHTGLGNYSRLLIEWLAKGYPMHEYYLMTPEVTDMFPTSGISNIHPITPQGLHKMVSSLWRSNLVTSDLKKLKTDIYHGLSNEIPAGIQRTGIRSVVTIHDLIFERYPKQYKAIDTAIYRRKFSYAAQHADKVIAISEQTKQDLIHYYNTPADKIAVCYQSCNPAYQQKLSAEVINIIKEAYDLPAEYMLYVGSVIERKNLLTICKAMAAMKDTLPLVVIGTGGTYMQEVKNYVAANGLANKAIFLSEQVNAKNSATFRDATDFPAIYQGAIAMLYPSIYEGFGIPILEALWSGTPVITSNRSCMPETGGDAAYYIDPLNVEEMITAIQMVTSDTTLRAGMVAKGFTQAAKFTPRTHAAQVMQVYLSL